MATTTCTEFVSIKTIEPKLMSIDEEKLNLYDSCDDTLNTTSTMDVDESYNIDGKIRTIMRGWTDKYKNRFSKWYLRRASKYHPCLLVFEDALRVDPFDCYKHLINWDRSFKKAIMKDKLIDKQRLKIRQEVYKIRVIDPITQNEFYVPRHVINRYSKHAVENDKDYYKLENMDIDEVDLMMEQGNPMDFGEPMIEQGKYTLVSPDKNGIDIKRDFVIIEDRDSEPILSYPFGDPEMNLIVQPYLDTSPFFTQLFQNCKNYCASLNKYMSKIQFKRGTPSYYRDWLFGTRRNRDDLKKFLEEGVEQGDTGVTSNDLEQTSVTSSSANITFIDERPVDITSLHTKGEVYSRDLNSDIAENDWTLNKVLEREYPIKDFAWSVSDESAKKLIDEGLPKMITDDDNCMITRQLKFFSFLRAGIHVRVQLNGTKFHCGRLLVYFKPITWSDDTEENFYSLTCYPSFFLDASVSNSGQIFIPFTHLLSYFSQEAKTLNNDSINTMGSLNIVVYNQLNASTASSTTLYGQIYVSLIDPYVHLPTYGIRSFSYGTGYMQGLEGLLKKGAGSLIDMGVGLDQKFTGGLVTGAGNAICNLLGVCDKPTDPVSANPIINRVSSPLCHGAGLDRSVRLGLSPVSLTNSPPSMLGAIDSDYDILTLCKLPCLLEKFTWEAANASGTQKFYMGVTPTWLGILQKSQDDSLKLVEYRPTMLAYISRAFCRWRGSLKIKIQVVATQFHSGRLALVFDPHSCTLNNLYTFSQNKSHNMIIMDIQEQQELVIDLPYFAVKPWLRCDHFRSRENLAAVKKDDQPMACFLDCDIMGMFRIFVLNQLVRPNNVPDKVDVNIFFYAGDNFELTIPNPVSPLSVRSKTKVDEPEANAPWYPWCYDGSASICNAQDVILNLYNIGAEMVRRGLLTPASGTGKYWYDVTPAIKTTEVIAFINQISMLRNYVAKADAVCKGLIQTLPNYSRGSGIRGDVKKIDGTTTETKERLEDPVITDISALNWKSSDILQNTQQSIQRLNDINYRTNENFNMLMRLSNIDPIQENREYHQIRVDGDIPEGNVRWERHTGTEQGLESYTTTRDTEGPSVCITEGNKTSSAAISTVSENAMQIQTLLRRYYPLWVSGNINYSDDFTVVSIPVSPAFVPEEDKLSLTSQVERRYEVHNLAWFVRVYTYWRGSMRYKIAYNADDSDVYVWHNPIDAKAFSVRPGFRYDHLRNQMNFASDIGISRVQQNIEVEVPYYSGFNQLVQSHISSKADLRAQNGTLFVAIRNRSKNVNLTMYISTGEDFTTNVLRAPPILHEIYAKAYTFLPTVGEKTLGEVTFPDLASSMQHDSKNMQIPGQAAFNLYPTGQFDYCSPIPPALTDGREREELDEKEHELVDFQISELYDNRQQNYMKEQMFSGYVEDAITKSSSVKQVISTYNDEVKPAISDVQMTANDLRQFLHEFKEEILPQILGCGKNAYRKTDETLQMVKDFIPKINEALECLNNMCTSSAMASTNIIEAAAGVSEWAYFSKCFVKIILITALWTNLVELCASFTWTGLVNVVCIACVLFRVQCSSVIQWLYNQAIKLYEDYWSKATDSAIGREQGFEEFISNYQDNIVFALAAIATVLYSAIFGYTPTWEYVKQAVHDTISGPTPKEQGLTDVLKNIHFSSMGFKAIGTAFEFFQKWITKIFNYFMGTECQEILLEKDFKEHAVLIERWIDEVGQFEEEDLLMKSLVDLDIHNKLYRLKDQGIEFTLWTMNAAVSRNVSSIIRDTNRRLSQMIKEIGKKRPMHGFRYSPFTIMMHGDSSVGKSNMMHHFTDMLRDNLKIPNYNSVYCVPTGKKFLDGYSGQTIIEWDDILQCVESDELLGNFINWRSNADTIVNMADTPEKGMPFTSKAIVMTTNNAHVDINTLRDRDAFRNRINVFFRCYLADGWSIKEIKQMQTKDKSFCFVRLSAYDFVSNELIRSNMTFPEAIEFAKIEFHKWDIKQNNLLEDYFSTHGSLRIPAGVVIQPRDNDYEAIIDDTGLTEEEIFQAQLFQLNFCETLDVEERKTFSEYVVKVYDVMLGTIEKVKVNFNTKKDKCSRFFQIAKQSFVLYKDQFLQRCRKFYEDHPNFCKVSVILSALGVSAMVFKQFYPLFGKKTIEESTNEKNKVYAESVNVKRAESGSYDHNVKVRPRLVRTEAIEEGTDDIETLNLGRGKVYNALHIIGWKTGKCTLALQCLAIGGKVILCPHHFFRRAEEGDCFYFVKDGKEVYISYTSRHMFRIPNKDAVLYYMGASFDSRKCIVNCFVEDKNFKFLPSTTSALLYGISLNQEEPGIVIENTCKAHANAYMEYKGTDSEAVLYKQYGWRYDIHTLPGECGALLLACNKALPPPGRIIGMHVAGYDHQKGGFSILLNREMIMGALTQMKEKLGHDVYNAPLPVQVNTDPVMFENCKVIPEGYFSYYGTMDPKFCPSQPTKTSFRKTPFYEEIYPSVKAPAMLVARNGISPLRNALGKFGKITVPFSAKHISAVRASVLNDLMMLDSDIPCAIVSDEIAIFGIDGVNYCDKMNMRSSPGWPYQCLDNNKGQLGKSYLFDEDNKRIKDPLLLQNYLDRLEKAKNGQRVPSIWRDCLKDELRPLEKVDEGKTRLFNIPPVDYSILVRKYFLTFEQAFYKGHGTFFSAVGINPESFEWTASYNRMRSYGYKCVAGDFKTFDGMAMAQLLWEISEMISDWYDLKFGVDEEARIVRRVLMDEMIHTFQLVLNCVYKTHQGNPSGNPITAPLNTLLNIYYMRLTWLEIMTVVCFMLCTMDAYSQNVMEEAYGDDNRLVIKDTVIHLFNQCTIAESLAKHGITYTDESKSSEMVPYRHLLDTSFLKRKYRFDPEIGKDIVLPIMDKDTITSLTNWFRDSSNIEEQLQENQRAALGFAFFHGREFYDDFNFKFMTKMREYDLKPICITYDEMLDCFSRMVHDDGDGTKFSILKNFIDLGF